MVRASVKHRCFPGPFHIRPSGFPSGHQPKGTRFFLLRQYFRCQLGWAVSCLMHKKMPALWRAKDKTFRLYIMDNGHPFLLSGGRHPWLIYCFCAFVSTLKFSWKIRVASCEPGRWGDGNRQKNARFPAGKTRKYGSCIIDYEAFHHAHV